MLRLGSDKSLHWAIETRYLLMAIRFTSSQAFSSWFLTLKAKQVSKNVSESSLDSGHPLELSCQTPAIHIRAGETPSAPCSISLYQKHPVPCSSSHPPPPLRFTPHHQQLNQVTGNKDVSAACPQPGNSLIAFCGSSD